MSSKIKMMMVSTLRSKINNIKQNYHSNGSKGGIDYEGQYNTTTLNSDGMLLNLHVVSS